MLGFFKKIWSRVYCRYKYKGYHRWSYAYQVRWWRKGRKRGKRTHHRYEYQLECQCCGHKTKWLRWKTFDEVYHGSYERRMGIYEET